MAIQWMDNFSTYGDDEANMLDGLWVEPLYGTLSNDPDGISGGKVLFTRYDRRVFSSGLTTVGVAQRVWFSSFPVAAEGCFLELEDGSANPTMQFNVTATGVIKVWRGWKDNGTVVATSTVPVLTLGAWHHIECKALISDTVGTVEVRVNGRVVIDEDTLDTKHNSSTTWDCLRLGTGSNAQHNHYVKDVICWDDSGTVNNDFMGDCQVVTLLPTADDTLNWTPSTGSTGYNLIDETTPDDADYISADSTPPAASIFDLSDVDADVVTIKGLQTVVRAVKTDGGTANLQVGIISNGDTDLGQDRPVTVAATYWFDVSELSPDTGVAYTPVEVNNAQLQIDRTV